MSNAIEITILGTPAPKQSARFRIAKNKAGKQFISSYQPTEIVNKEATIAAVVQSQLPKDFIPFDCPIMATVSYIFPIPKSMPKSKVKAIADGAIVYKDTKPDMDNLVKMFDSLHGIVFINDSRIVSLMAVKYYGLVPKTIISFQKVSE